MYKASQLQEQARLQLLEDLELNPNYLTEIWEEEEEEEEQEQKATVRPHGYLTW